MIYDKAKLALLQCELILAEIAIKEYKADWIPGQTVMRDAFGKFATKGSAIAQDAKKTASSTVEFGKITSDVVQSLLKDKAFRERAGLAAGLTGAKLIKNVASKVKANPKLEAKIDKYIAEIQKELAEIYGDDKSPFAQALRKTNDLKPPKDASYAEKLEFQVARYKALDEAIKNPEYVDLEKEKQQELLGNLVKYGVPVAVSFTIALAPELLLPLMIDGTVDLGAALTSAALGAGVDVGTNAALDKAGVENPVIRIVAGLLSGAAAAGIVSGGKAILGKLETAAIAQKQAKLVWEEVGDLTKSLDEPKPIIGKPKTEAQKRMERRVEESAELREKQRINPHQAVIDDTLGMDGSEIYVKSSALGQEGIHWRIIQNQENQLRDTPALLLESAGVGSDQVIGDLPISATPTLMISRNSKENKLLLDVGGFDDPNRSSRMGRSVRNRIVMAVDDTPDNEQTIRMLAHSALENIQGKNTAFNDLLNKAISFDKSDAFKVDLEPIKEFVKQVKATNAEQFSQPVKEVNEISSPDNLADLAEIIKKPFPREWQSKTGAKKDGILVFAGDDYGNKSAEDAGAWIKTITLKKMIHID